MQVAGDIWKAREPKSIGINSLTSNILCRKHNSELSEVDRTGIDAFHALRRFEEILAGRMAPDEKNMSHRTSGPLLERWCIKHAVNLFLARGGAGHWYDGSEAHSPPSSIVEAAFGIQPLLRPRGLYNFAGVTIGQTKIIGDQIGFTPLFMDSGRLGGCTFEFQALTFLLWLLDRDPPWPAVRPFYHHMGGHFDGPPGRASLVVDWLNTPFTDSGAPSVKR